MEQFSLPSTEVELRHNPSLISALLTDISGSRLYSILHGWCWSKHFRYRPHWGVRTGGQNIGSTEWGEGLSHTHKYTHIHTCTHTPASSLIFTGDWEALRVTSHTRTQPLLLSSTILSEVAQSASSIAWSFVPHLCWLSTVSWYVHMYMYACLKAIY